MFDVGWPEPSCARMIQPAMVERVRQRKLYMDWSVCYCHGHTSNNRKRVKILPCCSTRHKTRHEVLWRVEQTDSDTTVLISSQMVAAQMSNTNTSHHITSRGLVPASTEAAPPLPPLPPLPSMPSARMKSRLLMVAKIHQLLLLLTVVAPIYISTCGLVPMHAVAATSTTPQHRHDEASATPNIHAVVVSSSRYWFNYRHANNALAIVDLLRNNGVPHDHITLMMADEFPTNPRNKYKNGMYVHGADAESTLYNATTFVHYRGADVTVQNFLNVLLGIEEGQSSTTTATPNSSGDRSNVLRSNSQSNVLVYVTGHGGDQFFKFQDEEEITSLDFKRAFDQMHQRGRYRNLLFVADTCQAFTLADHIDTPNVITIGSSLRDENAYAHHSDSNLGLSVIERYTYGFTQQYKKRHHGTNDDATVEDVMLRPFGWSADPSRCSRSRLGAHIGVKQEFSERKVDTLRFADFFGSNDDTSIEADRGSDFHMQWISAANDASVQIAR